jgi:mRNA-degrading endonuclease RelE of RelBE toxin-antitoxin system
MNWVVLETKDAIKDLAKLPKHIQATYSYWRNIVTFHGLQKLREIKSFHFEKLKGTREGEFSCRLSKSYRVLFEIREKEIRVIVLEVNKHEY